MIKVEEKGKFNLSMLSDFYEFTMAHGYFENDMKDVIGYFDMFFREIPDDGGFAIMAGVDQLIEYFNNLKFTDNDIEYFKSKNMFSEDFLDYLKNFKFECDVWAIPEGTPIFPGEPLVIVRGPIIQTQIVETMVLLTINHQSLIATKSNRIVRAAQGRPIMEFGARRAQGSEAAILGARAAYIGGVAGSSCTITDRDFGIPALGTMAHSWIQVFSSELEAFRTYARLYPHNCVLLVDTYNVVKSGIPNAIKVFKEEIIPRGYKPAGIRIDSGDIAYLSKISRKMLDEAGLEDCPIVASSSLDEYSIEDLLSQGSKIDSFGVGERLITSKTDPVFGGVYKLAAIEVDGEITPKIKVSENIGKITNPGFKKLYRLFDKDTDKAIADVVTLYEEEIDETKPYEIFHPLYTWKRKTITNFYAKSLLIKIFDKGKQVYKSPDINEIQNYCKEQVATLWDEVKRFENPHTYFVDLSLPLWNLRHDLLEKYK